MIRLFVYGIFLNERQRKAYGMSEPEYATVPDYLTVGDRIVSAVRCKDMGLALSGLVVKVDPKHWPRIDALEQDYKRVLVHTTTGEQVYMYEARAF